jgi:hypothetical protein
MLFDRRGQFVQRRFIEDRPWLARIVRNVIDGNITQLIGHGVAW